MPLSKFFLPISGVFSKFFFATRCNLFLPKTNLMTVAVSNFQVPTR